MLISLCIVVMNRLDDIRKSLPKTIEAANQSPPVQIIILDYDSKDDLSVYIDSMQKSNYLSFPNQLIYVKSPNHKFFSISHSRNQAVLASSGDYIVIQDADISPEISFVTTIRKLLEIEKPVWMCEKGGKADGGMPAGHILVCKRDEFIDSGGYDERFNVCGPEDKDICMRLHMRGGKFNTFPNNIYTEEYTSPRQKVCNLNREGYDGRGYYGKLVMSRAMRVYYKENLENHVLVANSGREWGR